MIKNLYGSILALGILLGSVVPYFPVAAGPFLAHKRKAFAASGIGKTGMLAYYALDDVSSPTTWVDSHTEGIDLTKTNSPTSSTGKVSGAARFNVVDIDYLSVNSATLRQSGTTTLSLCAWVKTEGAQETFSGICGTMGASEGYGLVVKANADRKVVFYLRQGAAWVSCETNAALADSTWTHVAGTWDGSTMRIYVNGTLQTATGSATSLNAGTNAFWIGDYTGSTFEGDVDEVSVWSVALSGTTIADIYNAGAGTSYSDF